MGQLFLYNVINNIKEERIMLNFCVITFIGYAMGAIFKLHNGKRSRYENPVYNQPSGGKERIV